MQGCSQHLPAHDHGTHNGYTDLVSAMEMMMVSSFLEKVIHAALSFICIPQGAVATGAAKGHRGSDEEATGKPKKRQLCAKFSISSF